MLVKKTRVIKLLLGVSCIVFLIKDEISEFEMQSASL